MKRIVVLALTITLVAAACGGDGGGSTTAAESTSTTLPPYPDEFVAEYMEGCTQEGSEVFCQCSIDEFQLRMSLTDFLSLEEEELLSHPISSEVIRVCLLAEEAVGTTSTTTTTVPDFQSIGNIDDLIDLTIADLEVFWGMELPRVWGLELEPVAIHTPYFVSAGERPDCFGPIQNYEYNAFYCPEDDSIRWDAENLMGPLFEEFGDFTVALVMAHEWAHAIQNRNGFDWLAHDDIVSELQADCMAGAWTQWLDDDRSELLRLEPGDLEEGMSAFLLIGDELGTVPTGPNAHGTSFERLNSFFDGFQGGVDACATYEAEYPLIISWNLVHDELDLPYEVAADTLIDALEVFWSIVYPESFDEPWVPVSEVTPYFPSTGSLPACGGFDLSQDFYRDNVFYCPSDDFVAWDEENLFPTLYSEIGDFALGLLLGNQWSQAVQTRAGLATTGVTAELQADCFVGVWTAALTFEDNPMELLLSTGDLEEGISAFLLFSDAETGASAFQRFEAFKTGLLDGIDACI
jgi:predicted metalloprotease